jgi:hypothetical protein
MTYLICEQNFIKKFTNFLANHLTRAILFIILCDRLFSISKNQIIEIFSNLNES